MEKVKRDTTADLFNAVLQLVKDNGHYEKASAIMEYVLPNENEPHVRESIELSNYQFNFDASAQFGGSEGIYIDCYLSGRYTETELMKYIHSTGKTEPETRRSVGTLKTLRTDLEAMMLMGELCGALIYYAGQYVNENIKRYTPARELEWEDRIRNCSLARTKYILELADGMASGNSTENCKMCGGESCKGKQDGCRAGIEKYLKNEMGKYYSYQRYTGEEHKQYYDYLDNYFDVMPDCFENHVNLLIAKFLDLTIYQATGYVFTWLCTRKRDFIFTEDKSNEV